jgi:protein TonB
MFDKLVESSKQKQEKRSKRFFIATTLIYTVALVSFGALTIIGFSPALAESYDVIANLIPPPPPPGPAPQSPHRRPNPRSAPTLSFATPVEVKQIPTLDDLKGLNLEQPGNRLVVHGAPNLSGLGRSGGLSGGPDTKDLAPPVPPPPVVVSKPAAAQTEQQTVRLTSQITQGNAIRKVQPPYPQMARQMRLAGSVQVQITISETGEVADAFVLSGHPVLREASLQAVRQWLFKPTELNGRPVRAIGVITFNFKLD